VKYPEIQYIYYLYHVAQYNLYDVIVFILGIKKPQCIAMPWLHSLV